MTIVRIGFVAMSMELQNASPSQTMTFKQFSQIQNKEAGKRKLERIAKANLHNTLRILKHAVAHDIKFYRMTSRLIPLANHGELLDWDYINPLTDELHEIGAFAAKHTMRLDFHPDHFVLINSPKKEVLKNSIKTLQMHYKILKKMRINTMHRCVMHVGGNYKETDTALERFIQNWAYVPVPLQEMIMLENDDTSFTMSDALYLCEKLAIPLVFDYHHHLAFHYDDNWMQHWPRVVETWKKSPLPLKMHISSPKSEKQFRHHADFVDIEMFFHFLKEIKGSVDQIDCMIESKKKDMALFQLMREVKKRSDIEIIDQASFLLK
ncbi:UV DNA damage repair endonuclease UvsE [Bacillus sp. NEB1478]|uniref:UV DNA damage repair endonuclease UvsE n=1 Tax=Bacillus sp. NEB1478 TaxID=3073816 RepID=UPI00287399D5|nr:UV DNA damage repair endonuclease UvsE [Bacillus sp. NEB1478]WNB91904.1 UV DNA damage repair endonuclease UvsE [Bacillus sp. NEB1478]